MPSSSSEHQLSPFQARVKAGHYTFRGRVVYDRRLHPWSLRDLQRVFKGAIQGRTEESATCEQFANIAGHLLKDLIVDFLSWLFGRTRAGDPSAVGRIVLAFLIEAMIDSVENPVIKEDIVKLRADLSTNLPNITQIHPLE